MRQGPLSLLLCLLLLTPLAQAEEPSGSSTPLSLSAGSQITELQQRLKESERLRETLVQQLHNADSERESAQLTRLRQENQKLKLALKELQASAAPPKLITEQQQWFLIGGAVALFAALCGIFASGGHRKRRQWLN
nr:translation initiation factor 2 [Pseudomonas sp. BIGb0427]